MLLKKLGIPKPRKQDKLCFLVWNARSLNNKCDDTLCMLQDNNVDIAIISETWLPDQANTTTASVKSYGYNIIHDFRIDNRGGGTALIYKANHQFNIVNLNSDSLSTFEFTAGSIKCTSDMKILILCIYRTGPISRKFFEELDLLFGAATLKSDYIIIGGDFNIHTETINANASDLLRIASSYSGDSFVRFGTLVGSVRSRVSANGAFLRANRFPITTHSADIEFKVLSTARLGILSEM